MQLNLTAYSQVFFPYITLIIQVILSTPLLNEKYGTIHELYKIHQQLFDNFSHICNTISQTNLKDHLNLEMKLIYTSTCTFC